MLEVIDPKAADEALGQRLEAEERAAAAAASFELHDNFDGSHFGRFKISSLHAAMLEKALESLTSPAHRRASTSGQVPGGTVEARRPRPELLGQAFGGLIERLDPSRLPAAGGVNATVVPAVVRRLVDGRSVVLDMGRQRRLDTEAQRIAVTIEQRACTAEGCTRSGAWCQAHHGVPWSAGGATSVTNGRLLCSFHHGRAHSPRYDVTQLPNGRLGFHRWT